MTKNTSSRAGSIQDALAEAERLVTDIKDADLRARAFEAVLKHLLLGASPSNTRTSNRRQGSTTPGEPKTLKGTLASLMQLVEDGLFDTKQPVEEVKKALAAIGEHRDSNYVTVYLSKLLKAPHRVLARVKEAPTAGGRKTWFYFKLPH